MIFCIFVAFVVTSSLSLLAKVYQLYLFLQRNSFYFMVLFCLYFIYFSSYLHYFFLSTNLGGFSLFFLPFTLGILRLPWWLRQ